jgi:ferrous iron transport protein A
MPARTLVPVNKLSAGQSGIVRGVEGGRGLVQRLAAVGLFAGREVHVIRNSGPLIVRIRHDRLILGRGMAHRILVEPQPARAAAPRKS